MKGFCVKEVNLVTLTLTGDQGGQREQARLKPRFSAACARGHSERDGDVAVGGGIGEGTRL